MTPRRADRGLPPLSSRPAADIAVSPRQPNRFHGLVPTPPGSRWWSTDVSNNRRVVFRGPRLGNLDLRSTASMYLAEFRQGA
ncbi:hypothetical protein HPP92_028736 [Vanilla planifolia]|uniref:Uncharacterized protein n=1 Tax=Vanilla planifolia TaxID=51239 RepID=A0A835P9Z4_VANPL|nr:hypothetical protein HPP92_028736 [Vanilla planifolia]KAG0446682.1 hypothetical protein HPP92_028724 [Vanilla planifolia]